MIMQGSVATEPCFYYTRPMKILINAATHGDEHIGLAVQSLLKCSFPEDSRLVYSIGNPKALLKNKRFVTQDLNRSFPGSPRGNYESRRAYTLVKELKKADIVIDIHSTTSDLADALIVTKLDAETKKCIRAIRPKYLLVMNATKGKALIDYAKVGIAFEYGKESDKRAAIATFNGIKRLLVVLEREKKTLSKIGKNFAQPICFDVFKAVRKPQDAELAAGVKNYKLIKKGQQYGISGGAALIATESFYPILFGEKKYKDIFGFAARRIRI
jgi:succinylglutamate desuccinylase